MDFDRCTGVLSNLIHIDINDSADYLGRGAARFFLILKYFIFLLIIMFINSILMRLILILPKSL